MTFEELYAKHWKNICEYLRNDEGFSRPFLVDFPVKYCEQKRKLFVVGQETHKWCSEIPSTDSMDGIKKLMSAYREFKCGLNYKKGVFFRAILELETRLHIEAGQGLWSNLSKVDYEGGSLRPEQGKILSELFPVLQKEIEIAKPDIVVFLTGPRDYLIDYQFQGEVKKEPIADSGKSRIVRLVHQDLPKHTYRTYHPGYLNRKKGLLAQTLIKIVELCDT